MKKDKVIEFLNNINETDILTLKSSRKNDLCFKLEFLLRIKDILDDKNRFFYNIEETIEYKIN